MPGAALSRRAHPTQEGLEPSIPLTGLESIMVLPRSVCFHSPGGDPHICGLTAQTLPQIPARLVMVIPSHSFASVSPSGSAASPCAPVLSAPLCPDQRAANAELPVVKPWSSSRLSSALVQRCGPCSLLVEHLLSSSSRAQQHSLFKHSKRARVLSCKPQLRI